MLKIVQNLWTVGAPPRTPLGGGSSQRSPDHIQGGHKSLNVLEFLYEFLRPGKSLKTILRPLTVLEFVYVNKTCYVDICGLLQSRCVLSADAQTEKSGK